MHWYYSEDEETSFCLYKEHGSYYPIQSVFKIHEHETWRTHGWDGSFMDIVGNFQDRTNNPYQLMHHVQNKFKGKVKELTDEFKVSFPIIHPFTDNVTVVYKAYYCGGNRDLYKF